MGEQVLADLERALRGGAPNVAPQQAAAELALSRAGARVLRRIIASSGASAELRAAALYGFVWGYAKSADLALVRRIFENEREAPSVRGQAAEVLGSQFDRYCRPGHRRHVRMVSALVRGLDDPSPEVRFWSIYALARPEHTWLLPKLEVMASADTAVCPGMWTLRQEALWAIRWITRPDLNCDPRTL
jgi:HEAT repeat protein